MSMNSGHALDIELPCNLVSMNSGHALDIELPCNLGILCNNSTNFFFPENCCFSDS